MSSESNHIEDILVQRGSTHGDAEFQFDLSQRLKKTASEGFPRVAHLTLMQKEALEMILMKISRVCVGNPNEPDHWRDIAGYATLIANHLEKQL